MCWNGAKENTSVVPRFGRDLKLSVLFIDENSISDSSSNHNYLECRLIVYPSVYQLLAKV